MVDVRKNDFVLQGGTFLQNNERIRYYGLLEYSMILAPREGRWGGGFFFV